jgi:hypothetical protein
MYILSILKIYVRYLPNILCPYYKFIPTILLYFLKLLQMTFITIYINIVLCIILITCNKKLNFKIIFDFFQIVIFYYISIIMMMILECQENVYI